MLKKRSREILQFLKTFITQNGYSPSTREVVAGLNLSSTSIVDYHMTILEEGGYIHIPRITGTGRRPARAIVILDKSGLEAGC